jgi:hypothetical protein
MLLKSHFSMLIKYLLNWMTGWILSYKNTSSLPIRWDIIHMYIRAVSIANVKIGILTLFKIRHFAVSSVTIMCGGGGVLRSGAIPPLPQYAFVVWCPVKAQEQLYLLR